MPANKRVLIISPHFPPVNAADMQRVRMSLPYFAQFGWDAEVVTVDSVYSDHQTDPLLLESVPKNLTVHKVRALTKVVTSKIGFGNIAFRSFWFYKKKVNKLLAANKYNLVYFSTTQFPVCVLGAYWKKRFGIPYVIDMQDPWYSDYYQDKPKHQRPPKFWLIYRIHKCLERIAMNSVDGLISVSKDYITDLKKRYPQINHIPAATITFGSFSPDMVIAQRHQNGFDPILNTNYKTLVYIGRGGIDMHRSISTLFNIFKDCIDTEPATFSKIKFYFIGTSYAPAGTGIATITPLARHYGIENNVTELPDRISYYQTLNTLLEADALFVPGSDDPKYTASKIYPYLLTKKPLLAIFNPQSSALAILRACGVQHAYSYNNVDDNAVKTFFRQLVADQLAAPSYSEEELSKYSAKKMAEKQCFLFNQVTKED